MMAVTFVVEDLPPWKQAPADKTEKNHQVQRREAAPEGDRKGAPLLVPGHGDRIE